MPPSRLAAEPTSGTRNTQVRILVLASIAFAASAPGQSFLISVFVDEFLAGTGLSRTAFSILYAAGTIVSAVTMTILGRIIDRRGLRTAWAAVGVALAIACLMASFASGAIMAFVALALLRTSGQGAFPLVGTLLVAGAFERTRGRAMAVASLSLTTASVALPPLVALLIVSTDWRTAYRLLAVVVLLIVVPLAMLVPRRPAKRHHQQGDQHEVADYPSPIHPTRWRWLAIPSAPARRLLGVLVAPPLIGTAVTFHATSILAERGVSYLQAGGAVGLLGASAAVGVVITGAVLDRLRTPVALALLSGALLVGTLVLLVPAEPAAYVAFAALGLGIGASNVVNGTVWARTFGTSRLGQIQGMAMSATITAAALAPLVPAIALSLTGSYELGLATLAVVAAVALLLSFRSGVRE